MHVIERGTGTPLVLLHGFGVDHRLLLPLDPAIEAAGAWRRLYLDLPGHGQSPAGDVAGTEDVVAAVEAEILDRVGDEPFAILGNSFGALVARRIAHDHRDRVLGLATIAGVFVAEHDRRSVPDPVVLVEDPAVVAGLGDDGEEYAELAVVQTPENARAFREHVRPGTAAADQDAMERIAERYALDAVPEEASSEPFTAPTLILTARQDQVAGYTDAWARVEHYPRATFAVLDTAGHNLHLDQPSLTGALVTEWLARVVLARD
ncbi:alpha/beta hydrolase [Aeromicrobium senzhongii]|uniref:Alpha/beta hydrolase n=1 Tax=Aeromicrobium senzhongii TaxID=2663859 RepID=A0ABX6SWI3_9ACTN|nr:alpha/beta hydrolase [Aeromicrobium senzhongii]MTB87885.1 alpha/beta fold hydrolase [Aeromicrobium senzhongii]QNL95095.1 alpha/beta hydrolase [Aeromicrobium senzhongii]